MTRAEAEARIAERYTRTGLSDDRRSTRTHRVWVETWERINGWDATAEDLAAFAAVPRGQGHRVTFAGPVVTLHCELDSGD